MHFIKLTPYLLTLMPAALAAPTGSDQLEVRAPPSLRVGMNVFWQYTDDQTLIVKILSAVRTINDLPSWAQAFMNSQQGLQVLGTNVGEVIQQAVGTANANNPDDFFFEGHALWGNYNNFPSVGTELMINNHVGSLRDVLGNTPNIILDPIRSALEASGNNIYEAWTSDIAGVGAGTYGARRSMQKRQTPLSPDAQQMCINPQSLSGILDDGQVPQVPTNVGQGCPTV
ncbi:hypothetical protein F5Y04DRAFT_285121 [Hypomontagnella monticulosa]|nr:hypothetical protein F5Y04DRAFT_285121 [Hypomontagnella monticulosa]